jgi:hypothetical protein
MINSVSEDVNYRFGYFFQNTTIEFDLLPFKLEMDLFPLFSGQVTNQTRETLGNYGKREHAGFEHFIAQSPQQRSKLVERFPAVICASQTD